MKCWDPPSAEDGLQGDGFVIQGFVEYCIVALQIRARTPAVHRRAALKEKACLQVDACIFLYGLMLGLHNIFHMMLVLVLLLLH